MAGVSTLKDGIISVFSNEIYSLTFAAIFSSSSVWCLASSTLFASSTRSLAKTRQFQFDIVANLDVWFLSHVTFSSAQLNSSGERPSPCQSPVQISNDSDSSPLNLTFNLVFLRVSPISSMSFRCNPNSARILSSYSRWILSYAFLMSTKVVTNFLFLTL